MDSAFQRRLSSMPFHPVQALRGIAAQNEDDDQVVNQLQNSTLSESHDSSSEV